MVNMIGSMDGMQSDMVLENDLESSTSAPEGRGNTIAGLGHLKLQSLSPVTHFSNKATLLMLLPKHLNI